MTSELSINILWNTTTSCSCCNEYLYGGQAGIENVTWLTISSVSGTRAWDKWQAQTAVFACNKQTNIYIKLSYIQVHIVNYTINVRARHMSLNKAPYVNLCIVASVSYISMYIWLRVYCQWYLYMVTRRVVRGMWEVCWTANIVAWYRSYIRR